MAMLNASQDMATRSVGSGWSPAYLNALHNSMQQRGTQFPVSPMPPGISHTPLPTKPVQLPPTRSLPIATATPHPAAGAGAAPGAQPPASPSWAQIMQMFGQMPNVSPPAQQPGAQGASALPQGASGAPTPGMPSIAGVQTPDMNAAVQAYLHAVQGSFQPYFDQQQQGLKAQLAAQGILRSGAGNQGLQDLTAQQNAQVTGATAPLIQQGFGQQFQAATGNAGAYNQALMQMVQNQLQAQLANQQMGMQGQEFNANLINNAIMANTGYANNAITQGAGFGNNDYLNALSAQSGFLGSNLGSLGYILGQGASGGLNAYMEGQGLGAQNANQQGAANGYTAGSNPYGSYMPFSPQGVGSVYGPNGAPTAPYTPPTNPSVDPNAAPDPSLMPAPLNTYSAGG